VISLSPIRVRVRVRVRTLFSDLFKSEFILLPLRKDDLLHTIRLQLVVDSLLKIDYMPRMRAPPHDSPSIRVRVRVRVRHGLFYRR